jgi:excisionase family DNA binding protein
MPPLAPYLTIPETAELLRVSRRTVERCIADGTFASCKVRGSRRIVSDSLLPAIVRTPISVTSERAHTWAEKSLLSSKYPALSPNAKRSAEK